MKLISSIIIVLLFSSCSYEQTEIEELNGILPFSFEGEIPNYSNSKDNLTNFIIKYPDNLDGYYYRGLSYMDSNDYESAINDFKHITLYDDKNDSAYVQIAIANMWLTFRPKTNRGIRTVLAIESLDKAIFIKPNSSFYYSLRGNYKTKLKNYADAIEDYTISLYILNHSLDDDGRIAMIDYVYLERGLLYLEINQKDKACEDWKKALVYGNKLVEELISDNCSL